MDNKIKVIGICGLCTSGKDTAYRLLSELYTNSFVRFAFADTLKGDLDPFIRQHFGFSIFSATAQQKELIRPLMINYGMCQRQVDPDYWIKQLDLRIDAYRRLDEDDGFNTIQVITDCRFINEVKFFKNKYGDSFRLIEVVRTDSKVEPPEQEKINHPLLKPHVNYTINWPSVGDDKLDTLKPYIVDCYNHLFSK